MFDYNVRLFQQWPSGLFRSDTLAVNVPPMLTKITAFLYEVKVELQKASWPWDPKEKGFNRYKELSTQPL